MTQDARPDPGTTLAMTLDACESAARADERRKIVEWLKQTPHADHAVRSEYKALEAVNAELNEANPWETRLERAREALAAALAALSGK